METNGMRHEFVADVKSISDGFPVENDMPPVLVQADGLPGEFARFALRGAARRDAGKWYGRRVRVTIETIGDE